MNLPDEIKRAREHLAALPEPSEEAKRVAIRNEIDARIAVFRTTIRAYLGEG